MALVRGCHVIAKGNHAQALTVIPQILANGLLINTAFMGTAAWSFYATMVPRNWNQAPLVVFDVDDKYVTKKLAPLPKNPNYAFMEMYDPNLRYIPIAVLGFVNCLNPLVAIYNGPVGFF